MVKGLPGVWVWSGDLEQLPMSVTSGGVVVVGDSDDQYHPYIYIVKRRGETQNEGHPKGLSQFNL